MISKYAVEVSGLHKSYGKLKVLNNVNFKVPRGEILALLGPNGAGKTTTIRILSTLLKADSGSIKVNGFNPVKSGQQVRASIGLTGQFAAVDEYLTGRENVELIGRLYHLEFNEVKERAQLLLEKLDLLDAAERPAKTYSGGMKRRLDLAMSLVAEPPILFLDEPTTGLDPRSRLGLWEMIAELAKSGTTILLTTQYMEEAEYLANNVIVIDQGKVIAEGTVNQLKAKVGGEQVEVVLSDNVSLRKAKKIIGDHASVNETTNTITVSAKEGVKSLTKVLSSLEKAKIKIETASLRRPTLDDVFLALTGHNTEDSESSEGSK
ncbi:MAG: ATP-binding cassette domain-containing protein [bacterium]|nr:ATP-binding cassette domain-containing protein [bacterium]